MTIQPDLGGADPARRLTPTPQSPEAQRLLREILASPSMRTRRPYRRTAIAGSLAGVVAAAVTVVALGSGAAAPAYAVQRHGDGSVDVSIDYQEFSDAAALQESLDKAGVRAVVLDGPWASQSITIDDDGRIVDDRMSPAPPCARYRSPAASPGASPTDPGQAVSYNGSARFDGTQMRLRPDLLPEDGTFVLKILRRGGEVVALSGDVALGAPPTCLG